MPKFESAREFSKEHLPEERDKVAEEVKQIRREHFERKQDISEQVENIASKKENLEERSLALVERIGTLEKDLEEYKSDMLLRIFDYIGRYSVERNLLSESIGYVETKRRIVDIEQELAELNAAREDKTALEIAREKLRSFKTEQWSKWQRYEEEQEVRNVSNVIRDQDVVFVHGLKPYFVPGENSLLRKGTDWEKKLKIFLAFQPTISTSTIQEGDGQENLWSQVGVLLNGGTVDAAYPADAATKAKRGGEREFTNQTTGTTAEEEIRLAIETRESTRYNELVVSNPSVCGFYIALEDTPEEVAVGEGATTKTIFRRGEGVAEEDVQKVTDELKLPLYYMRDGKIYRTKDEALQGIKAFTPKEVATLEWNMQTLDQNKLQEEALELATFKIEGLVEKYVYSTLKGRQAYIELSAIEAPSRLKGDGSEVAKMKIGEDTITYIDDENGLLRLSDAKDSFGRLQQYDKRILYTGSKYKDVWQESDEYERGVIYNTANGTYIFDHPIRSRAGYIETIEKELPLINEKFGSMREEVAHKFAYLLHSFAEEAEKDDEPELARKARDVAETVISKDQYKKFLNDRLLPDGRIRNIREDIT